MKFSFFTGTIDRENYLKKCIDAFVQNVSPNFDYEHHILFMGKKPSNDMLEYLNNIRSEYVSKIIIHHWNNIEKGSPVMGKMRKFYTGDWFCKLDDDCIIRSPDYLKHVSEIINLKGQCSFSGFPVGLINNFGGVQSKEREVVYSKLLDVYYTLRKVNHIGGFGRITPMSVLQKVNFRPDVNEEDGDISSYCRSHNIPQYYLENAIIIEHYESTLGQSERIKNNKN